MEGTPKISEKFVTTVIIVVLVLLLIGIGVSKYKRSGVPAIDPNVYQAVFFENNQQYFGHLHNINSKMPYLTDIYYVRTQGPVPENPQQQQFTLIKLGNEIHGPEDVIYFNWDRVLYWENLRSDSEVVKGIYKEKAQRVAPQPPAPLPVQAPAPIPAK